TLAHLQQRFFEHRNRGSLPEGTVDKLIVSPLLDLAGLYDSRFTIRTEALMEISLAQPDELLSGRIDTLILQEQFWILVIEAKNTTLSLSVAIPQALIYMMAAPQVVDTATFREPRPVFGLVTNGDEFRFIKLLKQSEPNSQFDLSDIFSLLPPQRSKLQQILQVLKQLSNSIA
ncbi:type I restriction endonuclease, partial [Floridanema evergladense]